MYYEWIQSNKKAIIALSILLFTIVTIWSTVTYVTHIGKTAVTISVVPSDAKITMNNKSIGNGTQWVNAGAYAVEVKKDGFKTQTKQVTVTPDKKQNTVAISLTPVSDTAKKWAEANQSAYKANEAYGSIEARSNGEYFRTNHPITNVLPYTDPYYKIGYKSTDNSSIIVTITTPSPRYRYIAIQKFRELGFNPTDYRIEFNDFKSPLGSAQ